MSSYCQLKVSQDGWAAFALTDVFFVCKHTSVWCFPTVCGLPVVSSVWEIFDLPWVLKVLTVTVLKGIHNCQWPSVVNCSQWLQLKCYFNLNSEQMSGDCSGHSVNSQCWRWTWFELICSGALYNYDCRKTHTKQPRLAIYRKASYFVIRKYSQLILQTGYSIVSNSYE